MGRLPIRAGLGHQPLALAAGAETYRLPLATGVNYPVQNLVVVRC